MILISYGTRPEWIKLKTIIQLLKDGGHPVRILFTGQQKDIGEFEYDESIEINDNPENRLNNIVSTILNSNVFGGVTHVVVQGDTASSFAVALAAFNLQIPISHVEAGLRTYDVKNPYPEESYRQMISSIAKYHFIPTRQDLGHLISENKCGEFYLVGNTVIDTLPDFEISESNIVLVTMHRRENQKRMKDWFAVIEDIAQEYKNLEFIIPLHPNPRVREAAELLDKVTMVKPMEHDKLLRLVANSKIIITDSGGIQEEAAYYGKKVLVCRKATERPAENQRLVHSPEDLFDIFREEIIKSSINIECPFGDGTTSKKIVEILSCVV